MIINTPITVNHLTLPNRILRSATMENMADAEGTATEPLVRLYSTVAKGGAGLIVVGASAVEPRGRVWRHQLALWSDSGIAALSRIPAAIHESGAGKCAIQLHHGGTAGFGYSYGKAAAGFDVNSAPVEEIEAVITAFGTAAARAARAGFDAVAVHGAHGYLISQFLSPAINRRSDSWGGSPEGRMRFPLEVCRAIRSEIDNGMPLLWKMNCSDFVQALIDKQLMPEHTAASVGQTSIQDFWCIFDYGRKRTVMKRVAHAGSQTNQNPVIFLPGFLFNR